MISDSLFLLILRLAKAVKSKVPKTLVFRTLKEILLSILVAFYAKSDYGFLTFLPDYPQFIKLH